MTEENYNYRTSQIMLRNQFPGDGVFQIPIIPKSDFSDEEFRDLLLIGFDRFLKWKAISCMWIMSEVPGDI